MIGQFLYIPESAFLFFPKEQEICTFKAQTTHRVIFDGGVSFTTFQKQKIAQFHQSIKKQSKNLHLSFFSDSLILRFLQATKFQYDNCAKQLKKYKKWEQGIFPLRLTDQIHRILQKGLFYMVGRDTNYRPILVVNVARIIEEDLPEKVFYEVAGYFFSFIIQNCMIQGQVQNWITIIDLGKIGLFSLGGTIIDVISFLSKNFRCRLFSSFLVNCPGSITFLFGLAKRAMTEDQINKIKLQEQAQLPKEAFRNISNTQIQKKYGGMLDNYTEYWPLKRCQKSQTKQQQSRLISVDDYYEMYLKGLLKQRKIKRSIIQKGIHNKNQRQQRQTNILRQSQKRTMQQQIKKQIIDKKTKQKELTYIQDYVTQIPKYQMPLNIFQLFCLQ